MNKHLNKINLEVNDLDSQVGLTLSWCEYTRPMALLTALGTDEQMGFACVLLNILLLLSLGCTWCDL